MRRGTLSPRMASAGAVCTVSKRMKKSLLLILLFFPAFVLSACDKKQERVGKKAFLKDRARIQESQIEWSDDLSAQQALIPEELSVAPDLVPYPLAHITAFSFTGMQKSYPYLEGFASLDTSPYSEASMAALEGFCHALEAGKGEDSFMNKDNLYSLALFKYSLASYGHGSSKVNISSHIIGMPLSPQGKKDSLQCPVRLVLSDGGNCDIYVYLVKSASDWKVHQIDFMKKDEEAGT